jgi:hypothetical protein
LGRASKFLVLPERRSILYSDVADSEAATWRLCDLDGKNSRPFGDGFADYHYPSLSPDGTRLLMVAGRRPSEARPVIVDLATLRSTPVSVAPAWWAFSSWR